MQWKIGDRARSGTRCPIAGYWSVVGLPRSSTLLALGDTIPHYDGRKTDWVLTSLN